MEKCVFTDGTSPNSMQANLDMNHFRIQNLADAVNDSDPVTLGQIRTSSNVSITLPASISPITYGAVGDGIANDTAAVVAAANAAVAAGRPLMGGDYLYAVSGDITITGANRPMIRGLRLKQLTPAVDRKTLHFVNCNYIDAEDIDIDVGTASTVGNMNSSAGLYLDGGTSHRLSKVTVHGNGQLSLITITNTTDSDYIDLTARDAVFDNTAATDDVLQGIFLSFNTDFRLVRPRVRNLTGNAKFSGVTYDTLYTRGIVLGGNTRGKIVEPFVRSVDQGIDITGNDGNVGITVENGYSYLCRSAGVKLANSAYRCKVIGYTSEKCGSHGILISGPSGGGITNQTSDIDIIGCTALDIGAISITGTRVGFSAEASLVNTDFPKGIRFIDCEAIDNQGLLLTAAPASGATSATLAAPYTGTTGSYQGRFNTGELVTVSLTNGSTTVTFPAISLTVTKAFLFLPTMNYGFYTNVVYDVVDRKANELIGKCRSEGHILGASLGFHWPLARLNNTTSIPLTTGVETDVTWSAEAEDSRLWHSISANTQLVQIRQPGLYRVSGLLVWAAGAGTYRQMTLYQNATALKNWSTTPNASQNAGLTFDCLIDLSVNDTIKITTKQDSGGTLNLSTQSYLNVELVRPS